MNKRVVASIVLLSTTAILSTHFGLEVLDNRPLVTVDDVRVDLVGHLLDTVNTLTRNCTQTQVVSPQSTLFSQTHTFIEAYSAPASTNPNILKLRTQEDWLLAEVEFAQLQTAVILLDSAALHQAGKQVWVWSGPTAPWLPGPFIREWLAKKAPQAPSALIDCFEAQSKSYRPG
jgi:hypothetical protein